MEANGKLTGGLPTDRMPEAEVALRLAFYLLELPGSAGAAEVAIDGAMVWIGTTKHFPIEAFLRSEGWEQKEDQLSKNAWRRSASDRDAHAVFLEFIQKERNNVLKEYELGFMSEPVESLVTPADELFTLDENLYCPVSEGRFEGEDCRDVMDKGIAWWERKLSEIERCRGA